MVNIDFAKRLNASTASVRLVADEPRMELKERFSLLTVAAGLRACALMVHIQPAELQKLRSVAVESGLFPFVSRSVLLRNQTYDEYDETIAKVLRQRDTDNDHQVLWICSTDEVRKQIKTSPGESWEHLRYPRCCVQHDQESKAFIGKTFHAALIKKAGGDARVLKRAIRENWKVEIEIPDDMGGGYMANSIRRTAKKYPFALHIACRACLENDGSPTAELNHQYEQFAREFDSALYDKILYERE